MLSVGSAVLLVPVAHADEVYSRPSDGVFRLTGHGFGHGRGMSQWGAQGAALTGMSYEDILAFYYPGTTRTTVTNALIRVRLTADDSQLRVSPAAGLSVVQSNGTRTALPDGYTGWRLWPTGSGLRLQGTSGSGWTAFGISGSTNLASPVRFEASGGPIRLWRADGTSRDYRGALSALAAGTSVVTVDALPLESYLRGVVPQESPRPGSRVLFRLRPLRHGRSPRQRCGPPLPPRPPTSATPRRVRSSTVVAHTPRPAREPPSSRSAPMRRSPPLLA